MKQFCKSVVFFCLYYSGIEWICAKLLRSPAVAVLMYHGVCDSSLLPTEIDFHVSTHLFRKQMRALKNRYPIISLDELVHKLKSGAPLRKAVVITFDDGYRNNALHAAPVLREMGIPAVVFVATDYVDRQSWLPLNKLYWMWCNRSVSDEQMNAVRKQIRTRPKAETAGIFPEMEFVDTSSTSVESLAMLTWQEIREMAENGIAFGSHTHTHCNMAVENDAVRSEELLTSRRLLEEHLKHPIRLFAYPYGKADHVSSASRKSVIDAGYDCAITGEYGAVTRDSDLFRLPRLGYGKKIWVFTGEILYQLAREGVRNTFAASTARAGRATVQHG